MIFYKIKHKKSKNFTSEPYWVTEGFHEKYGETWVNINGGWCPKQESDEILAMADFNTKEQFIDYYRQEIYSYLIEPDSDLGWLSPDGRFYGCDWTKHSTVASEYFGKDDLELEKEGWVKIFRSVDSGEPVYCQNRLTFGQRDFIESHNVKFSYC